MVRPCWTPVHACFLLRTGARCACSAVCSASRRHCFELHCVCGTLSSGTGVNAWKGQLGCLQAPEGAADLGQSQLVGRPSHFGRWTDPLQESCGNTVGFGAWGLTQADPGCNVGNSWRLTARACNLLVVQCCSPSLRLCHSAVCVQGGITQAGRPYERRAALP